MDQCLYLLACMSVCLFLCLPACLSLLVGLPDSLSVQYINTSRPACLTVCIYRIYIFRCLSACLYIYISLPVCLSVYLQYISFSACLAVCISISPPSCLPVCIPVCLLVCIYLPTDISVRPSVSVHLYQPLYALLFVYSACNLSGCQLANVKAYFSFHVCQ